MTKKKMRFSRRKFVKTGVLTSATIAANISKAKKVQANMEPNDNNGDETPLKDYAVTHAGIKPVHHPRLGAEINGQTAIRYIRFMETARIDRLELGRLVYGRWTPKVPVHPAHVTVSRLNAKTSRWELIVEKDFTLEPDILHHGLSQEMSIEEMDAHFDEALRRPPYLINLGGIEAACLRVECDREHPTWPNHGECNGGPYNVPFGALNELRAYGQPAEAQKTAFKYNPILRKRKISPQAPSGMRIRDLPDMLLFESGYLSVGFSLRRPMIMHLGWDTLGGGQAHRNRILVGKKSPESLRLMGAGLSGPIVRTLYADYGAQRWSGEVSVEGNRVIYKNLSAIPPLTIDAIFTVESKRILIELVQNCTEDLPVLEVETWRLAWDLKAGITGAAAMPTLKPGRNGDVHLPFLWTSDGVGALSCRLLEGASEKTRCQIESYRFTECVTGGFVLADHPEPEFCMTIPKGTRQATFELAVTNFEPIRSEDMIQPSQGVQRHWATVFSCFRPEYRGFSNNSASVNCHLSQGPPIEIITHTQRPEFGPNPMDLARFTIEKSLLDGGGYGYYRNLYLDSDPIVISAAGRIHQMAPDLSWLRGIKPGLIETIDRIKSMIGKEGLVVCRNLSGNSRSYRWSTNAMDVIGFGHIDAYANAWVYRAFRNAAALMADLGDRSRSAHCRELAEALRSVYSKQLLNSETGWVAGWRSQDGELHDYAFTWVNGAALAFGLLDPPETKNALIKLEKLFDEVGPGSARLGFPCNLLPIKETDQMLPRILGQPEPTFEKYTDGSLSGWPATYYLRSLSIYGPKDRARKLANEMNEGYEAGIFNGGMGMGHEFRSWEGIATGYEGTLIGVFGPLYAIAIEQGVFKPMDPEWWPANA